MLKRFLTDTLPKFGNLTLFIGTVGLTAHSLRDNILKDTLIDVQQKLIKQSENLNKVMAENEQLSKQLDESFIKSSDSETIRKSLDKITTVTENLSKEVNDSTGSINVINSAKDQLNEILLEQQKVSSILGKYTEIVNSNTKSFNVKDFNDFVNDIYNILTSLSQDHLIAVTHISGCVTIFYCIIAIISALFGDKLITYLDLENKFPKLSKFIKLRRKYLEFTLILNIFLILLVISLIVYVNILILIYK